MFSNIELSQPISDLTLFSLGFSRLLRPGGIFLYLCISETIKAMCIKLGTILVKIWHHHKFADISKNSKTAISTNWLQINNFWNTYTIMITTIKFAKFWVEMMYTMTYSEKKFTFFSKTPAKMEGKMSKVSKGFKNFFRLSLITAKVTKFQTHSIKTTEKNVRGGG